MQSYIVLISRTTHVLISLALFLNYPFHSFISLGHKVSWVQHIYHHIALNIYSQRFWGLSNLAFLLTVFCHWPLLLDMKILRNTPENSLGYTHSLSCLHFVGTTKYSLHRWIFPFVCLLVHWCKESQRAWCQLLLSI